MPAAHVFIHPWLNQEEHWGGLFVSTSGAATETLEYLGRISQEENHSAAAHLPWFVPLDAHTGVELTGSWPHGRTVFLLNEPENTEDTAEWLNLAADVRTAGGKAAILANPHHPLPPPGDHWDFIFLETSHARTAPPIKLDILASKSRLALNGVRNRHDFSWGAANNMNIMSGEYLLMRAKDVTKPDMTRMHLLQLLSLVTQDADSSEIEDVFRKEPKLSYSLMRLVNSAALNLRTPVNSFSQAIALLGRRQLQRWLQLLVYADPGNNQHANPLLQWAAMRGRLMELALAEINPAPIPTIETDAAFMTGIFSLLDVLLNLPMEEILSQLPIAAEIKQALTDRTGPMGTLLAAIEAADHHKTENASLLLNSLNINSKSYALAQITAIDWAGKVCLAAG